jgi:hypothetical protein
MVFEWIRKRREQVTAAVLTPRSLVQDDSGKIDLADLTPDAVPYLGQVAYFELAVFESLTRAVTEAPSLADKEGLSQVAGEALAKHHGLVAILRQMKVDPAEAMAPFTADIDRFESLTQGRDWHETLLGVYLTAGFLNQFFLELAGALPKKDRATVQEILKTDRTAEVLVAALRAGIAEDPKLASRLALWGRRLMGDTQLVARSALRLSADGSDESKLEPVFTDLIAQHSKRMDILGLTA